VYVGLLVGVCRGARVKTDVTKTVHYDSIDQVDSLSGSSKIHLCPVVFRGGGVGVSRGRGGSHTSVSEVRILKVQCVGGHCVGSLNFAPEMNRIIYQELW